MQLQAVVRSACPGNGNLAFSACPKKCLDHFCDMFGLKYLRACAPASGTRCRACTGAPSSEPATATAVRPFTGNTHTVADAGVHLSLSGCVGAEELRQCYTAPGGSAAVLVLQDRAHGSGGVAAAFTSDENRHSCSKQARRAMSRPTTRLREMQESLNSLSR